MPRQPTIPSLSKRKFTVPLIGGDSASGTVTPPDIVGLKAWYKDTGMVNDGSNVSQWSDESGNANHLLPISAQQPGYADLLINNLPALSFQTSDGNDGTAINRGGALMVGTEATTFIVAMKTSGFPQSGIYTTMGSTESNHHPFSDLTFYDANFSNARKNCGPQVIAIPDQWRIFSFRSRDNSYTVKIDGQTQLATATNTFSLGNDFVVGAGEFHGANTTYAMEGYVAEIVVYNVYLSDAQEDQIGAYLADRFALTWTP